MRSKSPQRDEARLAISRFLERGEEAVGVFVEELFGNRNFTNQLSKTLGRAADAKKRVDRNMQAVLSALNVPSRADYDRLLTKIEALQGSLINVSIKLDRMLAAQHERSTAAARPGSRTRPARTRTTRRRAARAAKRAAKGESRA
jgi:hypothetical protein